jgi:acyl carrier protein
MVRRQIEIKTKKVISHLLDIDENIITSNSTLNDLGADSLDQVEILIELEKEFGIDITPNYPHEIYTKNIEGLYCFIYNTISINGDTNH